MSKKPVPGRAATTLLNALKGGDVFTTAQVAEKVDLNRRQISDAGAQLHNRGLMIYTKPGVYQLNDKGCAAAEAGVVLTSGPQGPTGARRKMPSTFRQRAWLAMRVRGQFTLSDIVGDAQLHDGNPYNNLARYARYLMWSGYLQEQPNRHRGTKHGSNGFKRYRLVKNTGRMAPVYSAARKMLHDFNTREDVSCQPNQ